MWFKKKEEIIHPSFDIDIKEYKLYTSLTGDVFLHDNIADLNLSTYSSMINFIGLRTSLYYEKGKLKSCYIYSPIKGISGKYITLNYLKDNITIPKKISYKENIFVKGFLLINTDELPNFDIDNIEKDFFIATSQKETFSYLYFNLFNCVNKDNKAFSIDSEDYKTISEEFYNYHLTKDLEDLTIVGVVDFLKKEIERDKGHIVNYRKGSENASKDKKVKLVSKGLLFYYLNEDKQKDEKSFFNCVLPNQTHIVKVKDVYFTPYCNEIGAVIVFDEEIGEFKIGMSFIPKNLYDKLKVKKGDKVLVFHDTRYVSIQACFNESLSRFIPFPEECPSCHEELSVEDNQKAYCHNPDCKGKKEFMLKRFVFLTKNPDIMELFLSDKRVIDTFLENDYADFTDILSANVSDLIELFPDNYLQIYDTIKALRNMSIDFYYRAILHTTLLLTSSEMMRLSMDEIIDRLCIETKHLSNLGEFTKEDWKKAGVDGRLLNHLFDDSYREESIINHIEVYTKLLYLVDEGIVKPTYK